MTEDNPMTKEQLKSAPTKKEFEAAHNEIARAYIQAVIEILFLQGHEELNFVKKTLEMPDGGTYLLQLQHVSGPKLHVQGIMTGGETP